jgi:hypothetical protein
MSALQNIGITHAGRRSLTLTILEEARIRFYATTFSETTDDGPGWAQAPDGRYWRLDVPPSVYHALTAGDACGVLWRGEDLLGALDWDAREQEPNATAYQLDPEVAGGHITELEGEVTCTATGKPALLGRVEADPSDEWWLVVVD